MLRAGITLRCNNFLNYHASNKGSQQQGTWQSPAKCPTCLPITEDIHSQEHEYMGACCQALLVLKLPIIANISNIAESGMLGHHNRQLKVLPLLQQVLLQLPPLVQLPRPPLLLQVQVLLPQGCSGPAQRQRWHGMLTEPGSCPLAPQQSLKLQGTARRWHATRGGACHVHERRSCRYESEHAHADRDYKAKQTAGDVHGGFVPTPLSRQVCHPAGLT
jgi:hypothetical protein